MEKFARIFLISAAIFAALVILIIAAAPDNEQNVITRKEYGDKYPFTIDNLSLYCENSAVYMKDKKLNIYPLNGLAKSKFKGHSNLKSLEDIWLIDDEKMNKIKELYPDATEEPLIIRKDITEVFDNAMTICTNK